MYIVPYTHGTKLLNTKLKQKYIVGLWTRFVKIVELTVILLPIILNATLVAYKLSLLTCKLTE